MMDQNSNGESAKRLESPAWQARAKAKFGVWTANVLPEIQ